MNDALKKMMKTPHETQKETIQRRQRQGSPQRNADIERRKQMVSAGKKPKPKGSV